MTTKADFVRSERGQLPTSALLSLLALPRRCAFLLASLGPEPKRVLDVGCATGYISVLLMHAGHRVSGIELNPQMAREARRNGVEVLEHDVEEPLPLASASIDAVHACEIIEHLFDTEGFLMELRRVLVPGGLLILSTPNLNSAANRIRVLTGRPLEMWGAYPADRHGTHIRVFNKAKVEELLERTGFRDATFTGINRHRWARLVNAIPALSELLLVRAVAA